MRLRLDAAGTGIVTGTDTIQYFKNNAALNRLRDIVIAKDGITFYIITDSVGATSGPSAGSDGGVTNRGSILAYQYTGTILAIQPPAQYVRNNRIAFKVYPVPAAKLVYVESKENIAAPLLYRVYDAAGKSLLEGSSKQDKFAINIEKLSKGVLYH